MSSQSLIARSIVIVALATALATFVHAALYAPEADTYGSGSLTADMNGTPDTGAAAGTKANAVAAPKPRSPTDPDRLRIPSLGIDASIQYVGLSYKGNIGIPTNFTDVAWYRQGTVPGKAGTALIDGHVDNGLGLPGVFKHLDELHPGDAVDVAQNSGQVLHFTVTSVQEYPYTDTDIPNLFSSNDGGTHLNLITCAGDWIQSVKSYNERLVIYTTLAK